MCAGGFLRLASSEVAYPRRWTTGHPGLCPGAFPSAWRSESLVAASTSFRWGIFRLRRGSMLSLKARHRSGSDLHLGTHRVVDSCRALGHMVNLPLAGRTTRLVLSRRSGLASSRGRVSFDGPSATAEIVLVDLSGRTWLVCSLSGRPSFSLRATFLRRRFSRRSATKISMRDR